MRVVIGEDEALMREGIAALLEREGFDVVAMVDNAPDVLRLTEALAPDLTITDIRLPPGHADDGLRAAVAIRAARADAPVLVLSQYVQRRYVLELIGGSPAGVGYLLKQRVADADSFCRDVRRVAEGGTVLDAEVVSAMVARARRDGDAVDRLTPRQREVLALIAEGRSNAAIARRLVITEKAVVQHVSHIYAQLALPPSDNDHRRVLAVIRYLAR